MTDDEIIKAIVAEEMTNQLTRIEHDSLCETETYKTRKG